MDGPTLFQKLLELHTLNPHSLAKKLKNSSLQSGYQRFIERKIKEPKRKTLQPAADFFRVNVEAFYSPDIAEDEWSRISSPNKSFLDLVLNSGSVMAGVAGGSFQALEDVGLQRPMRTVVVVGQAKLGDNGYYEEVSSAMGAGDGTVEAVSSDPGAYALRVKGDSMFPAIRDGWYVVVEPNNSPVIGEFVLVKMANGQRMVKELLMQNELGITVMSVNGSTRRTIAREEIDNHHGIQPVASILSPSKWNPI